MLNSTFVELAWPLLIRIKKHMRIRVIIAQQIAELLDGDQVIQRYVVSTSAQGPGFEPGSNRTPTGHLRIAEKIGDGLELGAVLKGRRPTGEVWSADPQNPLSQSTQDLILTRILWLEGCDPENSNTRGRYVYFHGTNQEQLLGTPASHGCIRMSNLDVIDLFDRVEVGTEVEILV